MERLEPQTRPNSKLLFTPLMISMVGIACTALALVLYHFILTRYWIRRGTRVISQPDIEQTDKANEAEQKVILESIPVLAYSRKQEGLFRVDQSECSVCLGELEEEQVVRLFPSCRHTFHAQCIDQWICSHSNCPVCRSPVVGPAVAAELLMQIREEGEEDRVIQAPPVCRGEGFLLPNEDHSRVSVKIQRDQEEDASFCSSSSSSYSSSSASQTACLDGKSCKETMEGSFGRLDCASLALVKSLSRLRSGHTGLSSGVLPR